MYAGILGLVCRRTIFEGGFVIVGLVFEIYGIYLRILERANKLTGTLSTIAENRTMTSFHATSNFTF